MKKTEFHQRDTESTLANALRGRGVREGGVGVIDRSYLTLITPSKVWLRPVIPYCSMSNDWGIPAIKEMRERLDYECGHDWLIRPSNLS